jgi:phenylpropionate dioxygenase-like ring-hydroxylating dioxygenase large terminal subunit
VTVVLATGRNTPVPEVFRIQSYPTYEAHGFIWAWWVKTHWMT